MSRVYRRAVTALLCLALCLTMVFSAPTRASADTIISKVLSTIGASPVVLMKVSDINIATSTEGCSVSWSWVDSSGSVASDTFTMQQYTLVMTFSAAEGYVFDDAVRIYLNNSEVTNDGSSTVSVLNNGSTLQVTKVYNPVYWTPNIYKHPGAEIVDVGGWASFVVTGVYYSSLAWYFEGPDGTRLSVKEAENKFKGMTTDGDGTERIMVYNIPAAMDGWKIMCNFINDGASAMSKGALITVRGAENAKEEPEETPEPTPEPTEEPEETPEPTEKPEESAEPTEEPENGEEHEHAFSEEWSFDEVQHWRACECGMRTDMLVHDFVWTELKAPTDKEEGEERGVCQVCGYTTTRAIPATGPDSPLQDAGIVKTGVTVMGILMAVLVIADGIKRRHRL